MKNKLKIIYFLFFVLLINTFFGNIFLVASEKKSRKKFRFEIFGGISTLNPADLNSQVDFDQDNENFFYTEKYHYFHSLYGDNYIFDYSKNGNFNKITHGFPFGCRFKYFITPSFAISVGYKYLERSVDSRISIQYHTQSLTPNLYVYTGKTDEIVEYAPYTLSVKGHSPMVGIHYGFNIFKRFRVDGYLMGGPLFAYCGFSYRKYYEMSFNEDYWEEQIYQLEINGNNTGLAVDVGLHIDFEILKNITLFIEGGYSFQKVSGISGSGEFIYSTKDINSDGYTESITWEGEWYNSIGSWNRPWSTHEYQQPVNWDTNTDRNDFSLDLSGIQVKLGISLRF